VKKIIIIAGFLLMIQNSFSQKIDSLKLNSVILKADRLIETDPRAFFKNIESLIVYYQGDKK
jgi:hypothetical protein